MVIAAVVLFAALGCDSKAKKSDDKPVDLPPAADPGAGLDKGVKGKKP